MDFHGALSAALGSVGRPPRGRARPPSRRRPTARVGATQADGDSIDIDAESAKLAANALEQQAAVSVARTRNAILRSAMGVG